MNRYQVALHVATFTQVILAFTFSRIGFKKRDPKIGHLSIGFGISGLITGLANLIIAS